MNTNVSSNSYTNQSAARQSIFNSDEVNETNNCEGTKKHIPSHNKEILMDTNYSVQINQLSRNLIKVNIDSSSICCADQPPIKQQKPNPNPYSITVDSRIQ